MEFLYFVLNNLLTAPIIAFVSGILFSMKNLRVMSSDKMKLAIANFLLFSIGLKGGIAFMGSTSADPENRSLFLLLGLLIFWGLLQPFFSYALLRKFTRVDAKTAVAISACFGSVSVMTYIAGANFLEKLGVEYQGFVVAALAVMEIPAIIAGLFISKLFNNNMNMSIRSLVSEVVFNKTVLMIFAGMFFGILCSSFDWENFPAKILSVFKPMLCLFLFNMGYLVGKNRDKFGQFSWGLGLFGIYMPIIGASFGILLSYYLSMGVGTGTLIAVLTASASYIAVPAVMRLAIPEAKEAIYLPLSLGIAFPFNVIIGIPLYYQAALKFL
ncbi:MAG: sodium-dependent bicarbonate transport family permease [Verrucomicrobia bacterium]|nr:sodium-dependent bicarbonate transport family permease [Verrucomicrobiota bacterium]